MAVRFSRFISGEYLTRIENQVELYEMIKQGKVLVGEYCDLDDIIDKFGSLQGGGLD